MVSPSGPRLAGKHGVSLLSLSMSVADGFAAIGKAWGVVEEQAPRPAGPRPTAARGGCSARCTSPRPRSRPSRTAPTASRTSPTTSAAAPGSCRWPTRSTARPQTPREFVEAYAESGSVVIGTPDDAIAYIEGLLEQSGGFGTFLMLGHDWADPAATMQVVPAVRPRGHPPLHSASWRRPGPRTTGRSSKRGELFGRAGQAIMNAITTHVEEKATQRRPGRRAADAGRRAPQRRDRGPRRRADPSPAFGRCWSQVKACGICGSDLHFAKHGADDAGARPRRWRACPSSAATPTRPRPRRLHGPRVRRRGARGRARHRGPAAGHDRHLDPDPDVDDRRHADRLQQHGRRPATASGCCCRRRCCSRCPTASTRATPRSPSRWRSACTP